MIGGEINKDKKVTNLYLFKAHSIGLRDMTKKDPLNIINSNPIGTKFIWNNFYFD